MNLNIYDWFWNLKQNFIPKEIINLHEPVKFNELHGFSDTSFQNNKGASVYKFTKGIRVNLVVSPFLD